jgi:hypothetical protein
LEEHTAAPMFMAGCNNKGNVMEVRYWWDINELWMNNSWYMFHQQYEIWDIDGILRDSDWILMNFHILTQPLHLAMDQSLSKSIFKSSQRPSLSM